MTEFDRKCMSLLIHLLVFGAGTRCLLQAAMAHSWIERIFWIVATFCWYQLFYFLLTKKVKITL